MPFIPRKARRPAPRLCPYAKAARCASPSPFSRNWVIPSFTHDRGAQRIVGQTTHRCLKKKDANPPFGIRVFCLSMVSFSRVFLHHPVVAQLLQNAARAHRNVVVVREDEVIRKVHADAVQHGVDFIRRLDVRARRACSCRSDGCARDRSYRRHREGTAARARGYRAARRAPSPR